MRLAKKYVTETKPLVEVMVGRPSGSAYSSRELAGRTFYGESKGRIRVQLPNGYVQFKKGNFFVPDSCELRLSLAEDGVEDYFSEIEKLRTRADSFYYDSPSSEIWMTRHTQDDKGELVYTIRVKQTDVGYRLVPEIPHIGKQSHTVNGFAYQTGNRIVPAFLQHRILAKKAETGQRVLNDTATNLGFDEVSEIPVDGLVAQVCIVPRNVDSEELQKIGQEVVSKGGSITSRFSHGSECKIIIFINCFLF